MKVAPVSADLLIKLALAGVVLGVGIWAVRRITGAVSDAASNAWGAAQDAADWVASQTDYINPASDRNLIYTGVNGAIWPDGGSTVGTWLYDFVHPEPTPEELFMGPPNPYAPNYYGTSVTTPVNGSGGAAFGVYPRVR
jgi:hypothetical protein